LTVSRGTAAFAIAGRYAKLSLEELVYIWGVNRGNNDDLVGVASGKFCP
jgi:hypothetical protein